ncbi:hypothetical protein H2Y56_05905 [Pectobacterium aroidearum]|uniref:Uncharacterized protein n=1 Tax=Pectobacterium aroidearum TaxID=1201031 RepID=A0ABR5ZAQ5_9GAMM|nr:MULTISPECIES: hypothetical protein [Pectobacterium]MBA5198860.1 hypothetical protein [Pectobacterium aroidearum]MBA5231652.1 hypothetical protein [Pectobacterium aroidearum]MBA5736830.1 hypothetical protein [Pectobacterium aroidearum]UXJ98889.1 hypothetical protein N5056_13765 [Pectobacterium aroidearum]GKV93522.1 hypothetical protein PEC301645_09690 [Pectobacterium carotovorum subsp. carotovorum]
MIEYLEARIRLLGKLRTVAALLNVVVLCSVFFALYFIGFFTRRYYDENDAAMCGYLAIISIINIYCICKPIYSNGIDSRSLIGLWVKRKKLEHAAKIRELEK